MMDTSAQSVPQRVLIVDDHPLFRKGAAQLLALDNAFELVGEAADGGEGLSAACELKPDLVLLDMNLGEVDGVETLKKMRAAGVQSRIIMLTVSNTGEDLSAAMRYGADGYLLKDMEPEIILEKLHNASEGHVVISDEMTDLLVNSMRKENPPLHLQDGNLTQREEEILQLIARGLSNKNIARQLDISEGTVKVHVKNLLRKLNLRTRLEAAVWALEQNNR